MKIHYLDRIQNDPKESKFPEKYMKQKKKPQEIFYIKCTYLDLDMKQVLMLNICRAHQFH